MVSSSQSFCASDAMPAALARAAVYELDKRTSAQTFNATPANQGVSRS
jgi:hypothetical protein